MTGLYHRILEWRLNRNSIFKQSCLVNHLVRSSNLQAVNKEININILDPESVFAEPASCLSRWVVTTASHSAYPSTTNTTNPNPSFFSILARTLPLLSTRSARARSHHGRYPCEFVWSHLAFAHGGVIDDALSSFVDLTLMIDVRLAYFRRHSLKVSILLQVFLEVALWRVDELFTRIQSSRCCLGVTASLVRIRCCSIPGANVILLPNRANFWSESITWVTHYRHWNADASS